MRGDPQVVEALNAVLTAELTAINQYFVHAKMCRNWGYEKLAKKKHEESIGEMKDADELIERILFLEGVPNMQRLSPVRVGEDPIEQHRLDLEQVQVAPPAALLRPGVAQRDGAVERAAVAHEVAVPLELEALARRRRGERRLELRGHRALRGRVQVREEILARHRHAEQPVVEMDRRGVRMPRAHPVDVALHLVLVGAGRAGARIGVVGAMHHAVLHPEALHHVAVA